MEKIVTNVTNVEIDVRPYPKLYFTDEPFEKVVDERVQKLWKFPYLKQKSKGWHEMRQKCLSASSISQTLMQTPEACQYYIECFSDYPSFTFKANPKKNCSYKETTLDLIMSKCGLGEGFFTNKYVEWGNRFEEVVTTIYSQMHKVDMLEFSLIRHPSIPFLGASPDGISINGIMLEIKCPYSRKVKDHPSLYYFHQVLLQLESCGLDTCDFMDCQFVRYDDEDTWTEEVELWEKENPHKSYHLYGMILGYMGYDEEQHLDVEKYIYAPPNVVTHEDFLTWSNSQIQNSTVELSPIHYKLEKYQICRIKASKEFIQVNLPTFEAVWKQIEYGRTPEGYEELKKIKDDKKLKQEERKSKKIANKLLEIFVDLSVNDTTDTFVPPPPKKGYVHVDSLF